jgi:hypothetical protein
VVARQRDGPRHVAFDLVCAHALDGGGQAALVALQGRHHAGVTPGFDNEGVGGRAEPLHQGERGLTTQLEARGATPGPRRHRGAAVDDDGDVVRVNLATARVRTGEGERERDERRRLQQERHLRHEPPERLLREQVALCGTPEPGRRHSPPLAPHPQNVEKDQRNEQAEQR